jgi:hypothetical protein
VSVRVLGTVILTLAAMAGTARASSFVTMGEDAPSSTPSIVMLGMPAPADHAAPGEPVPDVTDERVAAIPKNPGHGPVFRPMVIRGGLVGGAFTPATPAKSAGPADTAGAPAQQASSSNEEPPAPPPVDPRAPPPYLPPNGLGKHRY